ncbi:MAG: hypothetical protein WCP19_08960 [Chloroflexota bacterium]
MNTTYYFINIAGWTGAVLVLIAYALLSVKWLHGSSFSYQAMNMTGAVLLVINSYYLRAYPSVGVNAAWVGIALISLFHEWWKGPQAAIDEVKKRISKRRHLRKITLHQIKLPLFKQAVRSNIRKKNDSIQFGQKQSIKI